MHVAGDSGLSSYTVANRPLQWSSAGAVWAGQRPFTLELHAAAQEELAGAPGSLDEHEKVTNNHIRDGERLVELEVWAQNGHREINP
jgi:hypothetical protein